MHDQRKLEFIDGDENHKVLRTNERSSYNSNFSVKGPLLSALIISVLFLTSIGAVNISVLKKQYADGVKAFESRKYKKAHGIFDYCTQIAGDTKYAGPSHFLEALSSYRNKDWSQAINEFSSYTSAYEQNKHKAKFFLGNAYFKSGEYIESAKQFFYFFTRASSLREKALKSLERIIWGYLEITDIYKLKRNYEGSSKEEYLQFFLIKRLQQDEQYVKVIREAKKYLNKFPEGNNREAVKEVREKVQTYLQDNLAVAVLLPFSGDYSKYSQKIMNGVKLTINDFNNRHDQDIKLVKTDTKGDPLRTLQKGRKIVYQHSPVAIIGPLFSECTVALAMLAENNSLPIITPTASKFGLARLSSFIFQLSTPVEVTANTLAEYAIDSLHDTTFAGLAPDDQFGKTVTEKFFEVVKRRNRKIIKPELYGENAIDFTENLVEIKEPILKKYDRKLPEVDTTDTNWYNKFYDEHDKVKPRSEWLVDIDGFLLGAYEDELENVLPQIPFNYINTQILGCNGWHLKTLRDLQENYIDSMIFIPSNEYVNEERSEWQTFERQYRNKFRSTPDKYSALGSDAASLIAKGIKQGTSDAALLQDYLSGVRALEGAAGKINFNKYGANTYTPILQYKNGQFINLKH